MTTTPCDRLREQAEELVLGELDGAERAEALRHAAACPTCQAHLDELTLVADRLLLAAPDIEPPSGFEGRVLDHLADASAGPRLTSTARHASAAASTRAGRRWAGLLAVAAAVLVLAGGLAAGSFGLGRTTAPAYHESLADPGHAAHAVRSGSIVRPDGSVAGRVLLADRPRPLVLVTVDQPRPSANRVTCELVLADGRSTNVGTWDYSEVAQGAWAVGIDPSLLSAVRMNVVGPGGAVLATAELA